MSTLNLLRWRARRGMLELDILLLNFLDTRYVSLPIGLQTAFEALLELEDSALWDMIQARQPAHTIEQAQIMEWLRKNEQ